MAHSFQQNGQWQEAMTLYQQVLGIDPHHANSLHMLGVIAAQQGNHQQAVDLIEQAAKLAPGNAALYNNLGSAHQGLKQHAAALACFDQAISIDPNLPEAHCNRAAALKNLKQFTAALNSINQAISLATNYAEAYNVRGTILEALQQLPEALTDFEHAISLNPQHPKAHWNKALVLLMTGDWLTGWEEHEWRWQATNKAPPGQAFQQACWLGKQSIKDKTILLQSEQGLGDTLQFCRYVPLLQQQGAHVILQAQKPLLGLLSTLQGLGALIEDGQQPPSFDLHCPLMSLPLAFQTTPENASFNKAYLHAMPARITYWENQLGAPTRPRVGIAWSGNPKHENDLRRSIPLAQILHYLPDNCDYFVLQKDIRESDRENLAKAEKIYDPSCQINDFTDTAALCQLMDVILSVDTSIAHLAGALGKPVWIMLPDPPDWRWLQKRSDSVWYPSARLYRQEISADWCRPLEKINTDLKTLKPSAQTSNELSGKTSLTVEKQKAQARLDMAISFHRNGKLDEAKDFYTQVIQLNPNEIAAHYNRALIHEKQEDDAAALDDYAQTLALCPNHENASYNRGNLLYKHGQYQEALNSYDQAIAINPVNPKAHTNRALSLKELGQIPAALLSSQQALLLSPNTPEYHNNHGLILRMQGQLEDALASYDRAIELKPDYAAAYSNRGIACKTLGRFDAAQKSFVQAIAYNPNMAEAQWNLALLALVQGDWTNGWQLHEARWHMQTFSSPKRSFLQPLWLGKTSIANKTILLHCEQGLGDTLQFCRYASRVKQLGARVILEVQQPLIALLSSLEGVDQLVEFGHPLPDFDMHCPLMSLPLAFATTIDTVPERKGYLHSDPTKLNVWSARIGQANRPRIGLAWSGSNSHKNDANRSLALETLLPYLPDNCAYFVLQKDIRDHDKQTLRGAKQIYDFSQQLEDFTDTAALCDLMDVVLSVDTSVAHLAGALGKTTWLMLPTPPEWRWLMDRSDCVWYEKTRLYRQQKINDWKNVFEKISEALKTL
jgi:tetratricopeptide (TPR) repeat protein